MASGSRHCGWTPLDGIRDGSVTQQGVGRIGWSIEDPAKELIQAVGIVLNIRIAAWLGVSAYQTSLEKDRWIHAY